MITGNKAAVGARLLLMTLAVFSTIESTCLGGLFRLESETLSSARNGDDLNLEFPNYEFLSANYLSTARDLELNANLSVFSDPLHSRNDFTLHLFNLQYTVVPDLIVFNVGRNFDVQRSIRSTTIDTAGLDLFFFEKRVRLGAFAGKERRLELRQWQPTATLIGGYVSYTGVSRFPLFVKGKFQHRTYDRTSNASENLVQFSGMKPFPGAWSPEYLVDSEVNSITAHLNRLTTGFNLFPSYRTALRWRAETYDLKPIDGVEQPIFTIFSQGRLYESSLQGEYQFTSRMTASLSVAYDNYLLQTPTRTDGVKVEADTNYRFTTGSLSNSLYMLRSYGGEVYGDRVALTQRLTDRLSLAEAVDFAYYSKITSSRRSAFNSQIEVNQMLSDRLKLTLGGEMNSNNNLKYDARGFVRLTYLLWTET